MTHWKPRVAGSVPRMGLGVSARKGVATRPEPGWVPAAIGGGEPGRCPQRHPHLSLPAAAPAGMVVCNWVVILSVCITVLCVFDPTGRTFVKLRATKRRQRNLRTYNLRSVGWAVGRPLSGLTDRRARLAPRLPTCVTASVSPGLGLSLPQFPDL